MEEVNAQEYRVPVTFVSDVLVSEPPFLCLLLTVTGGCGTQSDGQPRFA